MRFLLPTGIGDSVWALHKVQAIRDKLDPSGPIEIFLACSEKSNKIENRALDFVRRFSFVSSTDLLETGGVLKEPWIEPDGCLNYMDEGMYDFDGKQYCVLTPNRPLEHGIRLEDWLPHYPINWDVFRDFRISPIEWKTGADLQRELGPYAVFYPGPLEGNTTIGHNREMRWKPEEWIELGHRVHSLGLSIVCVGAPYDAGYYNLFLHPFISRNGTPWKNLIGQTNIGELYSVTSHARFVVSYQAGVGIVSTYLGTPTAIFWRAHGDSIYSNAYLSFSEKMASAWVPPRILESGSHLPLIYGRHGVDYIVQEIQSRRWT